MTCGNPTCKYEFCWLCMKEAEPGHYENTPCAGKQFLDPEGFEYQLELNHPCLYKLYRIFLFIFGILMLVLFISLPGTFFGLFCYFMIYVEPYTELGIDKLKSSIKFILFMADVFIIIAIQSLEYMIIGFVLAIFGVITTIIILLAIIDIIKLFMELLCSSCCDYDIEYFYCTKKFIAWIEVILENIFG